MLTWAGLSQPIGGWINKKSKRDEGYIAPCSKKMKLRLITFFFLKRLYHFKNNISPFNILYPEPTTKSPNFEEKINFPQAKCKHSEANQSPGCQ